MIKEQEVKFKATKIIDYPGFRQSTEYSCGACVTQSALVYCLGSKYDLPEINLMKKLKTTESDGTDPKSIIKFLTSKGVKIESGSLSIAFLKEAINNDQPVIICIQAWGKQNDYENVYKEGHYVTVIGYNNDGFIIEDPSISARYGFIPYDDLDSRWHDVDKNGKKYDHFGIVIKCNKKYSPEKMEVIEGNKMKNIVDDYLEEIQSRVGIGLGIAGIIISWGLIERFQRKKVEKILQKNKEIVDKIILKHLNPLIQTTFKLGMSLKKEITGKYKNLYQYYPEHWKTAVQNLSNKEHYKNKVLEAINKKLTHILRKDKGSHTDINFFYHHMEVLPGDVVYDNIAKVAPESDFDIIDKQHMELSKLVGKANLTVEPMFNKIVTEIIKEITTEVKKRI